MLSIFNIIKMGTKVEINGSLRGIVLEARICHGVKYLIRVLDSEAPQDDEMDLMDIGGFYEEVFNDFEITSKHKKEGLVKMILGDG